MRASRAALLLATALLLPAPHVVAQDNPAIQEAVRLAGAGRGDEARRIVNAELTRARPGDPAYIEALYWRARLTAVGDSAERDLRRIAIEFPTSRWAPDALLQLAQLAMAAGNPVSAFALAERLRSDYPESGLRPRAALWAGRAAFDLGDARGACALLDTAHAEGAADVEFANQVAFYRGRCGVLPAPSRAGEAPPLAARPDTVRREAPPPAQPAVPPPGARNAGGTAPFSVQVAAVRTDRDVQRVLRTLRGAGYEGRVVTAPDGYRRIRVGAYETEGAAQQAIRRLKPIVGGRPFVVHER